jgi:hypothetical protein
MNPHLSLTSHGGGQLRDVHYGWRLSAWNIVIVVHQQPR